jgi:hypothetical protein
MVIVCGPGNVIQSKPFSFSPTTHHSCLFLSLLALLGLSSTTNFRRSTSVGVRYYAKEHYLNCLNRKKNNTTASYVDCYPGTCLRIQ